MQESDNMRFPGDRDEVFVTQAKIILGMIHQRKTKLMTWFADD
jgi:hypothetical protein